MAAIDEIDYLSKHPPTFAERVTEAGKSAAGGYAEGMAGFFEGGSNLMRQILPDGMVADETIGERTAGALREMAPKPDPRMIGDMFTSKLPGFAGGSLPYFAAGATLGPLAGPAMVGAIQTGAAVHEDALRSGATEEQAQTAFWQGLGVGTTMAAPFASMFAKWGGSSALSRAITGMAASGATGAGTGAIQRLMTNWIHNNATDDEVEALSGVAEDATTMGLGSLFLHGAVEGVRSLRSSGAGRQPVTPEEVLAMEESFREAQGPQPDPADVGRLEVAREQERSAPAFDAEKRRELDQSALTQQAKNLISVPTAELEGRLRSRLALEESALRKQFPDKSEAWYEDIADKRAQARDALNPEGDRAALDLKRLKVEPFSDDGPTTEQLLEAWRFKRGGDERVAEAGRKAYPEGRKAAARAKDAESQRVESEKEAAADQIGRSNVYSPQLGSSEVQPSTAVPDPVRRIERSGTTQPTTTNPSVGKQEVMSSYMNVLRAAGSDSPILQGRVPPGAAGVFQVIPNTVRIKKWGDTWVAAHEIGHALERAVFGWTGPVSPWNTALKGKPQSELHALGKRLYGNVSPNGGYLREGFAEYVRMWLSDPDALMKSAPEFTQWFDRTFLPANPDVLRAMEAARNTSSTWRLQGSGERIKSQIHDPESYAQRLDDAAKTARYLISWQAWTQGDHAWKKFEQELERKIGRPLRPDERLSEALTASRRQADAALNTLVDGQTILDDGVTVTGKSLKQELAPAEGKADDFVSYLYAKRAQAYYDMREPVIGPDGQQIQGVSKASPKDPGISKEDADAWVAEIERDMPEVAAAAQGYYAWGERFNDFIASVEPEMGAYMKNMDALQDSLHPGGFESNYAPLKRRMDEIDGAARKASRGGRARRMDVTRSITGSGREVKSILPEILKQANERLEMAYARVPLLRLLELADAHPEFASPLIRLASEEHRKVYDGALDQARTALTANGDIGPEGHDLLGSAMSFFAKPITIPGQRDPIISVYRGGKLVPYEINADLYKGLLNLHSPQFKNTYARLLLTGPKNMVVQGSTALNVAFGWVTNPMMDLPSFVLNTKHYGNPALALSNWTTYSLYSLLDGLSNGWLHSKIKSPYYDAYQKLGLEFGQNYHANSGRYSSSAKRLLKTGTRRMLDPGNVFDYAGKIIGGTEKAARVSEIKGYLKSIGWDGKRPLTADEVMQARTDSKQVTIDFSQAGDIARSANEMIPFFNSPIQAGAAFVRAAKHHPIRFAAVLGGYAGIGLALWNKNKDKDWYQELPMWDRMMYWHDEVEIDGRKELFRWRKPGEVGAILGVLEELSDASYRKRAFRTGDVVSTGAKMVLPSAGLPVLLNEAVQQSTSYDYFQGRPFIPKDQESLAAAGFAHLQSNEYTSEAAKWLGAHTGISPLRLDHGLRALFGGAPRDVLNALGFGADTVKGASDIPFFGRAFKAGGPVTSSAQSIQDFYRLREVADGVERSGTETAEQARLRLMLMDAGAAIAAINWVRQHRDKTNSERDASWSKMAEYAKKASKSALDKKWDPVTFKLGRQVETMKKEHGGDEMKLHAEMK